MGVIVSGPSGVIGNTTTVRGTRTTQPTLSGASSSKQIELCDDGDDNRIGRFAPCLSGGPVGHSQCGAAAPELRGPKGFRCTTASRGANEQGAPPERCWRAECADLPELWATEKRTLSFQVTPSGSFTVVAGT